MDIAIFTVIAFAPTGDGKFKVLSHYVAGTNSEDAQRRILAHHDAAGHLPGRRFIGTDQASERFHVPACRLYVAGMTQSFVDEFEMGRWVEVNTKPSEDDENFVGFREF